MKNKTLAVLAVLFVGFQTLIRADLAIMPLGDSITFGAHVLDGGYRYPLFVSLNQAGIGFHFVGQNKDNSLPLPYPDQWGHNGFPGATIKELSDNFNGNEKGVAMVVSNLGGYWMTGGKPDGAPVKPDLILLLAGTNNVIHPLGKGGTDLAGMESQYTDMMKWFAANRPDAQILVGTILPVTREPATQNEQVLGFNKWLKDNVSTFGPKCTLIDLYAKFTKPDGSPDPSLLGDGVHPNQAGYDIMGKTWSDAILALVNSGALKKEAPAAATSSFALPSDKQSPIPEFKALKISPATAAPGATLTVTGTLVAGNNALTAPVVAYTLKEGKGKEIEGIAPSSITLPDVPPHGEGALNISFQLPTATPPGVYDFGATSTSPEGSAIIRFGVRVTVTAPGQ